MTHGFWVLFFFFCAGLSSPSLSSSFFLAASSSSVVGSRRIRQRRLLSGDHSKVSTSWGVSVSRWASPPMRLSSQTWVLPSWRADRNARYLPSGLHRGLPEETPFAVSGTASPPANGTIQIRCSELSSFSDGVLTV